MDLKSFEFWNSQLIPWITLLAIGCLEAMEVVLDLNPLRGSLLQGQHQNGVVLLFGCLIRGLV